LLLTEVVLGRGFRPRPTGLASTYTPVAASFGAAP
jgi:hypothetical protein